LGVVIIAASLVADYYTGGRFGEATHYSTYSMGAAMIFGGVVQLLTPMPKGLGAKDRPNNTPSYAFNGPLNTQA
jgi:predicted phage tail protein